MSQTATGREDRRSAPAAGEPATVRRKSDHLRIALTADVDGKGIGAGFERYRFLHQALPELDMSQVDTSVDVLGRRLAAPLLVSSMTGGTDAAGEVNRALAEVAQGFGLAMGLGSGRVLLEHPELLDTFRVRHMAPDVLLLANLGAVQLNRGVTVDDCRRLVDLLEADALVLHLNPLQEAVQPEGDTCFGGLLARIETLCSRLGRPVVVKEVGSGIGPDTARRLIDAGVAAVDVAGAGGTSWSEVERHRIEEPVRARVAGAFADWGIPTAEAVRMARRAAPGALIFASGGVRTGTDVAKAIALGADVVGMAAPFLRAAHTGRDGAERLAAELLGVLRVAMFCIGARTLAELRCTRRLVAPDDGDGSGPPGSSVSRLTYRTAGPGAFIDITDDVASALATSGVRDGLAHVYSTHTTAAVRINENEHLLVGDFQRFLQRMTPDGVYEHDDMDSRTDVGPDEPANGAAHCRHLLLGTSETLPVVDGRLGLGRWQRIFLIELCSARERQVVVQAIG